MATRHVTLESINIITPKNNCEGFCKCIEVTKDQVRDNFEKGYGFIKKKPCPRYEKDPYKIFMKLDDGFLDGREKRGIKRLNRNKDLFVKIFNAKVHQQNIQYIKVSEEEIDFHTLEDGTLTVMGLGKRDLHSLKKDEIEKIPNSLDSNL